MRLMWLSRFSQDYQLGCVPKIQHLKIESNLSKNQWKPSWLKPFVVNTGPCTRPDRLESRIAPGAVHGS